MTNLLIKLFIKDKDVNNPETRGKYGILSSATGIIVNILLSIVKMIIGIIAGSISIISDALNNITDVGSSVVTMIGFKVSQKNRQRSPMGTWKNGIYYSFYSRYNHFNGRI